MAVRVLIVDDHAPFRALARMLLVADGFDVVGEAVDGADALVAAHDLRPDVVLLDVQLPGEDGFAVAEHCVTVAYAADLLQKVADINDSQAISPQPSNSQEQPVHIGSCQRTSGLVKDHHFGAAGQRAGNLDKLLHTD